MPRDVAIEPVEPDDPNLERLLARLTNVPGSRALERARQENESAVTVVDAAQKVFAKHCQRLTTASASKLDRAAVEAEAALIAAQVKHRATIAALHTAREAHAPALKRHVDGVTQEVRKALAASLAEVERIAATLCSVSLIVERDGGTLPPVFRGAYAARAMCRHVAAQLKL